MSRLNEGMFTSDRGAEPDTDATETTLAGAWEAGWHARHNYDERGGEPPPANPYEETN